MQPARRAGAYFAQPTTRPTGWKGRVEHAVRSVTDGPLAKFKLVEASVHNTLAAGWSLAGEVFKDVHPQFQQGARLLRAEHQQRAALKVQEARDLGATTEPSEIWRLSDLGDYALSLVAQGAAPLVATLAATRAGGVPAAFLTAHTLNTAFNVDHQLRATGEANLHQASAAALPASIVQIAVGGAFPKAAPTAWLPMGAAMGSTTAASQQASTWGAFVDLAYDVNFGRHAFDGAVMGSVLGPFTMGARLTPQFKASNQRALPLNPPINLVQASDGSWFFPERFSFADASAGGGPSMSVPIHPAAKPTQATVLYSQGHRPPPARTKNAAGSKAALAPTKKQAWDAAWNQVSTRVDAQWRAPLAFLFDMAWVAPQHIASLSPATTHFLLQKFAATLNPHLASPLPVPKLPGDAPRKNLYEIEIEINRALGLRVPMQNALDTLSAHQFNTPESFTQVLPEHSSALQLLSDLHVRLFSYFEKLQRVAKPTAPTPLTPLTPPIPPIPPKAPTVTAPLTSVAPEPKSQATKPTVQLAKTPAEVPPTPKKAITKKPRIPKQRAVTENTVAHIAEEAPRTYAAAQKNTPTLNADLTQYGLNATQITLIEHLLAGHDYTQTKALMGDQLKGKVARQVYLIRKKLGLVGADDLLKVLRANFSDAAPAATPDPGTGRDGSPINPNTLEVAIAALKQGPRVTTENHIAAMAAARRDVANTSATQAAPASPHTALGVHELFLRSSPPSTATQLTARDLKPMSFNALDALLRTVSGNGMSAYGTDLSPHAVEVFAELAPTWMGADSLPNLMERFEGGRDGLISELEAALRTRLQIRAERSHNNEPPQPAAGLTQASKSLSRETVVQRLAQMSERELKTLWAYIDGGFTGGEIGKMTGVSDRNVWLPMTSLAKALGIENQHAQHVSAIATVAKPGQTPSDALWEIITQRRQWAAQESTIKPLSAAQLQTAFQALNEGELLFLRVWSQNKELNVNELATIYPAIKSTTVRHYRAAIYQAFGAKNIWELDLKIPQGLDALLDAWSVPPIDALIRPTVINDPT